MRPSKISSPIQLGKRDQSFTNFLKGILSKSRLNKQTINKILNTPKYIVLYNDVFTHKTADAKNNYEFLEFLGDTTLNKAIAWYLSKRFNHLNCSEGVKILTRLKINLISKRSFAGFAKELGFWEFVSADLEVIQTKREKTLEDMFEAFFAATERILDDMFGLGVGYPMCYNIIKTLLDDQPISLRYEDLFDAKTRLKEIFDYYGKEIGSFKYTTEKRNRMHYVDVVMNDSSVIGSGYAPLKIDAQQRASEKAIRSLKRRGIQKPLSKDISDFLR